MLGLRRISAGRTASVLEKQQRHVAPRRKAAGVGNAKAASSFNPWTGRAIASMVRSPPRLAVGRKMSASAMTVPEKLVTMVPWVPAPLQPFMDKLHPIMIKERRPLAWLGINTATNAGSLCGHASFAILTAAYLETDVLTLRVLVLSGSTLNILFNLFRVVGPPVWIPIKWNVGFLALNAVMVMLLVSEREEAEELKKDPEQARIYEEIFMPTRLSPVDFLRLMEIAERRVMLKGNDLNQEGRPHEEVFLIVEGTAEVKSEGVAVSHLQSGGFVGSMAFNRFIKTGSGAAADGRYVYKEGGMFRTAWEWFQDLLRKEGSVIGEVAKSVVEDKEIIRQDTSDMERSNNTITATSDVVAYVWDMHVLREFLKRRPMIGASLQKAIAVDLVNKVDQSRDHHEHYRQLLAEALDGGRITSTERKNLQRYREVHHISLAEHKERLMEHNWTEEDFNVGFQEEAGPENRSEAFLKYEALLKDELAKGEVNAEARLNLRKFRSQAGIDAQEHLLAIEKLGWTADDYEVGGRTWASSGKYRPGATSLPADFEEPEDVVAELYADTGRSGGGSSSTTAEKDRYRGLLAKALAGGVVQSEEKEALRRYREIHAISLEEHNDLLASQGWDEGEFEAGIHRAKFFQQYAALVERELAKGELKPKARSNLRKFRTRLSIDAQDHLLAVEKQGWTADEYEAGTKHERERQHEHERQHKHEHKREHEPEHDKDGDEQKDPRPDQS